MLDEGDKKEGLLKRLKITEDKNKDQLDTIKDQGEKNLQILAKKTGQVNDVKNIFFRNKINFEAIKVYDKFNEKNKKINYTKVVCIGSSIRHQINFTIFLDLKTFAESLYNGSLSLEVAKLKQRNMENEIKRLENYNPKKEKFKKFKKILFILQ